MRNVGWKNRENLKAHKQCQYIRELLALNDTIITVMTLKAKLEHIWTYRSRTWIAKELYSYFSLANTTNQPSVIDLSNMLVQHRDSILKYCQYPIHSEKLEGMNKKIKFIKRKSHGFDDLRYFTLKIYHALSH